MKKILIKKPYSEMQWGWAYHIFNEKEYNSLIEQYHLDPQDPSFKERLFNIIETEYYLDYDCTDYSDFVWEGDVSIDKWDDISIDKWDD